MLHESPVTLHCHHTAERPVTALLRLWPGQTIPEVAKRLNVVPRTLRSWANGTRMPSATTLQQLAAAASRDLGGVVEITCSPRPPGTPWTVALWHQGVAHVEG